MALRGRHLHKPCFLHICMRDRMKELDKLCLLLPMPLWSLPHPLPCVTGLPALSL